MQVDKSNWRCYQLNDNSVYYGEIGFLRENGEIAEHEEPNTRIIRHGQGIQLFGTSSSSTLCKYEGAWHNDQKHGQGTCIYPNNAIYFGALQWNKRHGYGKYTWPDGKTYEGEWKDDRMEGSGVYRSPGGMVLRGSFRSNYYVQGDILINPLIPDEDFQKEVKLLEAYKIKRKLEEEKRDKAVKLHRIPNLDHIESALNTINNSGRVAVILAAQQAIIRKEDVYEKLRNIRGGVQELDLRGLSNIKQEEGKESMRQVCRNAVKEALAGGQVLLLNIDDSSVLYEELFDPNLADIIHSTSFPAQLFNPADMRNKFEIWKIFRGEDEVPLNKNYLFVVWSKSRLDESLDDQDIIHKFEKRFAKSLNLECVDLVLCHSEIVEEDDVEDGAEESG